MIHFSDLSAPVLPRERRKFFSVWRVLWRETVMALEWWQSVECENAAQRNGSVMTDSLESDIAARVWRSRGL
jgi:hypothetical protein